MSFFHAAALPKVQLRNRVIRMRDYLQRKYPFTSKGTIQMLEQDLDFLDLNNTSQPSTKQHYLGSLSEMLDDLEKEYPNATSLSDETLGVLAGVAVGAIYSIAIWLAWKAQPETVYTIPIVVMPASDVLSLDIKNANAA